ncbi:MAG: MFS transporter [Rhizobiaceae bacterium]
MNPTPRLPLLPTLSLALGQTLIWAATFYLFPALLLHFEAETDWSKTELTAAFTGSLLVAAGFSATMGRFIDAGSGSRAMIGGMIAAATILVGLSQATEYWQFALAWLLIGVTMAASLYEPCFAMLVRHLGDQARPAITRITLVAGFAGTVAFPLANWIAADAGWRLAVLAFAALVVLAALPATIFGLTQLKKLPIADAGTPSTNGNPKKHRYAFWLLAIAFALTAINHGMLINHLLPLLAERGVGSVLAVTAASVIGPMQVFGRVVMIATERSVSTRATTIFCFLAMTAAIVCLFLAGAATWLIFAFIMLHGAPWGVMSIVRPAVTRDVLGGAGFGLKSGRINALSLAGSALAPFGGALIWQLSGYSAMLMVAFVLMIAASVIIVAGTARNRGVSC